jgi:hypothetical protein
VLEKPKNDVLRTDTCHGYRPKGAFLPPTILVSGLARTCDKPHSAFLAAESVFRPGNGFIGGSGSVGIVLSKTSVEVVVRCVVGTRVLERGGIVNDCCVVIGFTGFTLIKN